MFSDHRSRKLFIIALTISALVLILVLGTQFALANQEKQPVTQEAIPDSPTGWGDDGILEVGVEWINDFPGTADDRSHWDESCDGLYNQLLDEGWTSRFHWTDWDAWETDFKNESLSGQEDAYVDNVDIAMVCTHGSGAHDDFWNLDLSSVYFGSSHTDQDLSPGDAYLAYGDKDLEWLAFDSCSVLSDGGPAPYYNRGYWSATMNKLHLLLGFKNTMYVWAPGDGDMWGYYMNGLNFWGLWVLPPRTVLQSWFQAVDDVQPSVTCARVLANTSDNYNDYLHGKGYVSADPSPDGYYWYWDHCSAGTKQALTNFEQPKILAMPVIPINERIVDEDYVKSRIAPSFDLTGEIFMDDMNYYMLDTSNSITVTLQVDRETGSFSFHNISKLWVPPSSPPSLPNAEQAFMMMEEWFKNKGEPLPGIWYRNYNFEYFIEEMVEMNFTKEANGVAQEQKIASIPTNGVLTYPRTVAYTARTVNGTQQIEFPVYGPGGQLKIYFGDGGEIIGMQGGSRDLLDPVGEVNILDQEEVWKRLMENPKLAVPEIPWVADSITYDSAVLGYYEMPYLQHQRYLIPVWKFNASFFSGVNLLAENVPIYVPAAEEFMPPVIEIVTPADGSTFMSGEPIYFEGSVKSDFKPFTFEWNSSSDGYLGNTLNIVAALGSEVKSNTVFNPTVSFQVTDANGLTSTATISLAIKPIFWLPLITK